MKHIPIHKLQDNTDIGFEMRYVDDSELKSWGDRVGIHRDDYYIFFLVESGSGSVMIDFTEVHITEKSVYYILPGQVHHRINNKEASVWFMAVDTLLIPRDFRAVFERHLLLQQPYKLDETKYQQCCTLVRLLNDQYISNKQEPFYFDLLQSLLNSFLAIVASGYTCSNAILKSTSRPYHIAHDFKKLLTENLRTEKRPSVYAAKLNISESYLNEALKKATGFSVTYWILHEVMMEARRLLYYSEMNVKEIANDLGYDDHAYFSRLFKKSKGVTPLQFRVDNRE